MDHLIRINLVVDHLIMEEVDKEVDREVGREVEAQEGIDMVFYLPLPSSVISRPILQRTLKLN